MIDFMRENKQRRVSGRGGGGGGGVCGTYVPEIKQVSTT